MTLGRCPFSIFCSRGTPPSVEPTNPASIEHSTMNTTQADDGHFLSDALDW